jgi:F-type H+-transporting ATPase subunit delta
MKIPREARKISRELFGLVVRSGRLDPGAVTQVADALLREKPRHYFQILKEFSRLVRLEAERHHAIVESSVELDAPTQKMVQSELKSRFGAETTFSFRTNPALIGGMRVKLGSDVWDGSVRSRLEALRR